jgi:hypothetical protein
MNDAGSSIPEQGTGADPVPAPGNAEVFVPPARPADPQDTEPDQDAVPGDGAPGEPPAPLEGYEHV